MTNPAGAGDGGRHPGWREWDKTGAQPDSPFGTPILGPGHLGHHQQSALDDLRASGHMIHRDRFGPLGRFSWRNFFEGIIKVVGGLTLVASWIILLTFTVGFSAPGDRGIMTEFPSYLLYCGLAGFALVLVLFAFRDGVREAFKGLCWTVGTMCGFALFGLLSVYWLEGPKAAQSVLEKPLIEGWIWAAVCLILLFIGTVLRAIVTALKALGYVILCYTWLWVPVGLFLWLNHYCASRAGHVP